MDDISLLDVTVAYMSEINKSKTIKCLGYCLVIYFYWGDSRREPTWESLTMISMSLLWPDDLNVPVLYCICFVTTDKGIHRHRNLLCFVKKEMLKTINQCTTFKLETEMKDLEL